MSPLGVARRSVLVALFAVVLVAAPGGSAEPRDGAWRVVDSAGRGVSGAAVTVYGIPVTNSPIERVSTRIAETTSGEEGVLDGGLPQVDELALAVDHPRFAPRLAAGAPASFRVVRLDPGRSWSGRVEGADDRSVAEGRVCVRFPLEIPRIGRQLDFERCGEIEAGRFTVGGLPADVTGRIHATAPGYVPLAASYPPEAETELVLETGFLLSGRVVGSDGGGVRGASVAVTEGESTASGEDGEFEVRAPALPAEARFRAPGHHEKVLTVTAVEPDEPLVVRLTPGPTLVARILGSDGQVPESGTARLLRYRLERAAWSSVAEVDLADQPREASELDPEAPGAKEAETTEPVELYVDLPGEGRYRLVVAVEGYSRHREPTFSVGAADHVDLGLIHLSQGAGVTARVVDALSGEPLPGVLGELSPTGMVGVLEVVGDGPATGTSDAEGELRIVGQEAGRFELRLRHRDHATRIVDVELEREQVEDLGSVWLSPGTEVEGRITDRSGEPRSGLQVRIVGAATGSLAAVAERTTDDEGRFAAARLGPGEYRVEVHGDTLLLDQGLTVTEDQPGIDLELTVGGTRWRGRVYIGERPVTGGMLLVRPISDNSHQRGRVMVNAPDMPPQVLGGSGATSRTTVGPEGTFEILDAPTGLVLLTYLGNDGREVRERLIVPPEAEVSQDVRLTDSRLEGVVLDAELGTPLPGALLRLRDPLNMVMADAVSGKDGSFRLTGFDAATHYQIEAELEGYRPRLLQDVGAGEQNAPLQVLLEPVESSSLEVLLERSDGSRAARAAISLFSEGGWMLRSQILDPYGEIVFDDVVPGRYVLLWHDASTGTGSAPVEVAGDGATRFARVLQPGVLLALECGETCAGETLPAVAVLGESGVDLSSHLPAVSPALRFPSSGRLVLGHLQPGIYLVRSWLGGRHLDHRVTVRPGEPAVVVSSP